MDPVLPFVGEGEFTPPESSQFFPPSDTKMDILLDNLTQAQRKNVIKLGEREDVYRVNVMTSAVALIYEKLRTFIDYNEDHLLRKSAIHRILKRRFIEPAKIQKIADNLIKELISAGYLPNEKLPESMKIKVAEVLTKYHILFNEIQERQGLNSALKLYQWMLDIAAVELEEVLAPHHHEKVYIRFLYEEAKKRIVIEDQTVSEKQADLYLFIAVNRSLVKSDRSMLNYLLLKLFYPEWNKNFEAIIPQLAENIEEVKQQVDAPIDVKLVRRMIKKIKRFSMMTIILREVIESPDTDLARLNEVPYLEERVRAITLKKYKAVRKRLSTTITRSIVYVFLTKMLLALLIEVPFDYWVYGQLHYFSIFVNITFPSLILITIAVSTKSPDEKNTKAMVEGIIELLSTAPAKVEYLKPPKKRSIFTKILFNAIYIAFFLAPFYLIILLLRVLNFSVISIGLFLVFLSIVSFFGTRIRSYSKELFVQTKKETLLGEFVDFFTSPILRFGKWLSLNFSKVNIFAILLDFVIEAPLKYALQVLEEWFGYFKERKEDVY